MTKQKNTKRALLASVLSMMLCMAMLVGSTFAWFTDSISTGKNKIIAGNLDVQLEYASEFNENGTVKTWTAVDSETELFREFEADGVTKNLWEPGHTELVYLKISNVGSLALKYQFSVTASNETKFTNALGEENCKLSDYLVFGQVESKEEIARYGTREAAWNAAGNTLGLKNFTKSNELLKGESEYVALIVYMPTTVGNEANYRGDVAPSIDLGVNLVATQTPYEKDSFSEDYDRIAALLQEGYAFVESPAELDAALKEGKNVVLANDITISELNAAEGTVIEGNGNTITGTGAAGLSLSKNVEYKNVKFALEKGWGAITSAAKFTNCTFDSVSPYLFPKVGEDIVFDGCTFIDTILQICYNEGSHKPESSNTIITNNKFVVNNTDDRAHAIVLGGGTPEFWANGADTVTIEGNEFTPRNMDNTYIAYYIYGEYNTTLTSVPVFSKNTFNGDANLAMNSVNSENQYPISRASGYVGTEELPGLTRISNGFYKDAAENYYASTADGLKAMNDELLKNRDFNQIKGKSYNLFCDINASGKEWESVSLTTGSINNGGIIFNGNGHTISNMKITNGGMFNMTASGSASNGNTTIRDLTLDKADVTGNYHVGAIWGQMYGDVVLDNVHVKNSNITGLCNVGGLIGRNGDQGNSTIKFINCSVSDTTVTATATTSKGDPIGASAFLGATLKCTGASVALTFEGENTKSNTTLISNDGVTGGGVYNKSVYNNGWQVESVNGFEDFNNRD